MALNRNTLLNDLKTNVIEVYFIRETGLNPIKISLSQKLLPPAFKNNEGQVNEMELYHANNPTLIGAWNMDSRQWSYIDINTVAYVEAKEDYY